MNAKRMGWTLFFLAELVLCMYVYSTGAHGWYAVRRLQKECMALQKTTRTLQEHNDTIEMELHEWVSYPAYQELHARTHLQLAAPREEWYHY